MTVMMMKKRKKVILIPYPAQGHVNPMLKLASVLFNLGFKPIIITPEFIHRRISPQINPRDGISFMSIPDGLDEGMPRDFFAIEMAMEKNMALPLEELIRKININDEDEDEDEEDEDEAEDGGIGFLVVDLLASWAIDVGRRCGVAVAGFWPAMQATYRLVAAIPDLIRMGVISENGCPRNQSDPICLSPNEPTLSTLDLPWLIGSSTARNLRFKFWMRTLNRSKTLQWILTNTFPEEYNCQSKAQQSTMLINNDNSLQDLEIGPLIMQASMTISSGSFWTEDTSCLEWLDKQNMGSVVYVSFGSWVSPIGEAKIRSLAFSLEASRRPFVWVLGQAWRGGLPEGYIERVAMQGRVVSWAPQMKVLLHNAVGCYLTHCGWNSTLEAIQCKKPLLCYPIAGDQFLNCGYIVNVWKMGTKIEGFEFEEIENGIRKVVEDEQMGQRIERLNQKIFGKEGISIAMTNIMTFIQHIGKPTCK